MFALSRDAPSTAAAAASAGPAVDVAADAKDGGSVYLQMGIVLACIGCVVLYMLFQRWRVRKAVERARRESEEMQRSPRPFTAAECARRPSMPALGQCACPYRR